MTTPIATLPMCSRHPAVVAAVAVPRGDHPRRYLCGDCLRDERPIIFISLHVPAVPRIV